MSPQDWLVLVSATAFFLVGVAISPLAWLVRRQEQSDREEEIDHRFRLHARDLKDLQSRMHNLEIQLKRAASGSEDERPPHAITAYKVRRDTAPPLLIKASAQEVAKPAAASPPTLIAIPKLAPRTQDSDTNLETFSERYAAIWDLADSGSAPEAIARATGQPIGHVELILGLRRQLHVTSPRHLS